MDISLNNLLTRPRETTRGVCQTTAWESVLCGSTILQQTLQGRLLNKQTENSQLREYKIIWCMML